MITMDTIRVNFSMSEKTKHQMYGVFKGYRVSLVSITTSNNYSRVVEVVNSTWFLFTGLTPYTKYGIRIAVRNDVGLGNYSAPVEITTGESGMCVCFFFNVLKYFYCRDLILHYFIRNAFYF